MVNNIYKAKQTIISYDYYYFTITKETLLELKSIIIKGGNIYVNLENNDKVYPVLLEIFEKYFEIIKY